MTTAIGPATLYQIPQSDKDPARFMWWGIFVFVFCAVSSCWLASLYVGWMLHITRLAMPWDVFIWTFLYNKQDYGEYVLSVLSRAQMLLGAGAIVSLLIPVSLIYRQKRRTLGQRNDLYGSAHWASPAEVQATGLLPSDKNRGGVLFGAYNDGSGHTQYLRHKGPEHMLVFAPTRSGKGVGIVVPTLLSWDESVLVHDIKGENWELTSGFRAGHLGQRCIRFAPAESGSARFNPLHAILLPEDQVLQRWATQCPHEAGRGPRSGAAGMTRRKAALIGLLAAPFALAALAACLYVTGWRLNCSASEPVGFYRVRAFQPGMVVGRNDLIAFCPDLSAKDYPFVLKDTCPKGAMPFLKRAIGLPGDVVRETDEGVWINGEIVAQSRPRNQSLAFHLDLPRWRGERRLGDGEYWVYGSGDSKDSFDSRYYGPVSARQIVAVARNDT